MTRKNINYQNILFFITILFFAIGFVHISFAIIGVICFIAPFILFAVYKDRIWCKFICPRAGLFTVTMGKIGLNKKLPEWLTGNKLKSNVLTYFAMNLFFITMSTFMVAAGQLEPINYIRFLIIFPLPFEMPQILDFAVHPVISHFAYRVYSVMFTSTIVGLVLGFIYTPRAWCIICPIQTLTNKNNPVKTK